MSTAASTAGIDLLTPERVADPYPVFAELRRRYDDS